MNLYNNEEENKKEMPIMAKGGAPYKKTSIFGKAPLLSRVSGGLMDKLKNLSRRDMAFVGVGLSVLVMAPVAEFVMSKPSSDNLLTPGFGSRDGSSIAGVYEPGINALSQGSADGSGEVITPLSSRDPASLILGSQAAQPPAPPPTMSENFGMRDAIKDAGRAAFSEATKSAGAPTPIPRMQSALRSAGSFFSGGEGTRTGGGHSADSKITDAAKSASGKAAKRSMVGPVAAAGYKGVAGNSPGSASKSALEKLRAQADKSAGNFSGAGATGALDRAAADAIKVSGDGGMGAGADGDKTKSPSNSSNKNSHSSSGESLAMAAAKARQQKALEWEFYKKYEIPKQIINAILTGFTGSLTKFIGEQSDSLLGMDGSAPTQYCWQPKTCPTGSGAEDKCSMDKCSAPSCAQKQAITAAGKDKGDATMLNCLCGKGNKPTYGVACPEGGATSGSGTDSSVPVTNPSAISSATAKDFTDYDAQLVRMVNFAKEAEDALDNSATKKDEKSVNEKAAEQIKSLQGAFSNLGSEADKVQNALSNLKGAAETSITDYSTSLIEPTNTFSATDSLYQKYTVYFKRIKDDAAAKKIKPSQLGANIEAVISDDAKIAEILQTVTKKEGEIKTTYDSAKARLGVHNSRLSSYKAQAAGVNVGISKIMTDHKAIVTAAGAVSGTQLEVLSKLTGRPKVNSTEAGPEDAPLKNAAVKVRAVNYDKLWEKEAKFDSEAIATAEVSAWKAFDDSITAGKPIELAAPMNFVTNYTRSKEIAAGLKGYTTDLADIKKSCTLADNEMVMAKAALGSLGVNECYFSEKGCTGTTPVVDPNNGGNGTGDAAFNTERDTAVSTARSELSTAVGAADAKNKTLQALKAIKGSEKEMAAFQKVGADSLAEIKTSETKINGYIDAMSKCKDKACVTTQQGLIKAEMDKIAAAQKKIEAAYDSAYKISTVGATTPPAGISLSDIKTGGNKAYGRVVAAYKAGEPKWTNFPKGDYKVLNDLRASAKTQWGKLEAAYKGIEALHTTTSNVTEKTKAEAKTALTTLKEKANAAEAALASLTEAYNKALKFDPDSGKCYKNAKGCAEVSAFYVVQQWTLLPNDAPFGMANQVAYPWLKKYLGKTAVSSAKKADYCKQAFSTSNAVTRFDSGFFSMDSILKHCRENWFERGYKVDYDGAGQVQSLGDNLLMIAPHKSGDENTGSMRYGAEEENVFKIKLLMQCNYVSASGKGSWRVNTGSLKVDMPVSTTKTTGVNLSVGPSFAKVGGSYTEGKTTTLPYGTYTNVPEMKGAYCGGNDATRK